jgi:hypothetical protein
MVISDVLKAMVGLPGVVAMRPRGVLIVLNANGKVMKIGRNGPHSWQPTFQDLVSVDWQCMSPETMAKMKAAHDAQQAAAAGVSDDNQSGD